MKNMRQYLFIVIALTAVISSCTKSGGDVFLGTWQGQGRQLIITKAGENAYTIRVIPSYGSTQTATYEKGNLMIAGMVACSFLDGKIISDGVAYEKVNGNYSGSGTTDQRNTPSAKEREEKRIADSIRVADSLAMVQAEMQRKLDMQRKAKGR